MNICIVDKNESVSLADIFSFVSDFETKTGFGLPDIYEWLNPDITEPEHDGEGYRFEEAKADYQSFQSQKSAGSKRIPVEIAQAFFSVCENYRIYGGMRAKDIEVNINSPAFSGGPDRVFMRDFRNILKKEKERTRVSNTIIWKLLPPDIQLRYSFNTFVDGLKEHSTARNISSELAGAICEVYSKIPGRNQAVVVTEGLTIPPFFDQHSFSVSGDVALLQFNEKFAVSKSKGIYSNKREFIDRASIILGVDVGKLFDKSHNVLPRLRVAICLALLEGHPIPAEVLDVHAKFFQSKLRNKPDQCVVGMEICN